MVEGGRGVENVMVAILCRRTWWGRARGLSVDMDLPIVALGFGLRIWAQDLGSGFGLRIWERFQNSIVSNYIPY